MIINKMTLHNFRQYYNTQEINFSNADGRHITVIHGENGTGKTALLNAFNWVLYGITDLPAADKLMNEYALDQLADIGSAEMWVELSFISRETEYLLKRYVRYEKKDLYKFDKDTVGELSLQYYQDGQLKKISNPKTELNRILPEKMRNYFFFDGERIDNLSRHDDNDEIKDAIKIIMDLEIIEKGITHTKMVKKELMDEFRKNSQGDTERFIDQLNKKEYELSDLRTQEKQILDNIQYRKQQKAEIEKRLSQIASISEIQNQRTQLENEKSREETELVQTQKKLKEVTSKKIHLLFTNRLTEHVKNLQSEVLAAASAEKTVPVPNAVIENILQNETCICGTTVSNEEMRSALSALLDTSKAKDKNVSLALLAGDLNSVENAKESTQNEIDYVKTNELKSLTKISDLTNQIEEITAQISERDYEDLGGLESKRKSYEDDIADYQKKLGLAENNIKMIEGEISALRKSIQEQQALADSERLAKKRYTTAERIIEALEEIYKIREFEVKNELRDRLRTVYEYFLRKDFSIGLTEDFKLVVKKKSGGKVAMSQGERQITSLAFIGAIVEMARENYRNKGSKNDIVTGGIYPLIMDSPFGALDSDHRRRVSKGIQKLSDQLIVIVSTSQWQGEVESEMNGVVANRYTLSYEKITEDGKVYDFTKISEVKEYA